VVTVRFETRGSGPGPARTFPSDIDGVIPADPLDSLDWPGYVAAVAVAASDHEVGDVEDR
jgi:DNA polymerase-4